MKTELSADELAAILRANLAQYRNGLCWLPAAEAGERAVEKTLESVFQVAEPS